MRLSCTHVASSSIDSLYESTKYLQLIENCTSTHHTLARLSQEAKYLQVFGKYAQYSGSNQVSF
jgi:hypothetical protein